MTGERNRIHGNFLPDACAPPARRRFTCEISKRSQEQMYFLQLLRSASVPGTPGRAAFPYRDAVGVIWAAPHVTLLQAFPVKRQAGVLGSAACASPSACTQIGPDSLN